MNQYYLKNQFKLCCQISFSIWKEIFKRQHQILLTTCICVDT